MKTSPPSGPRSETRRVLHVSQPVEAGVAIVVRQLVAHQVQLGWDVAVACPPEGSLAGWVRAAGGAVLPWPATRQPGPTVGREVTALRRVVRRWAPDIIHLHSSKAGLSGRLAVRGRVPTVYQPHAWSFLAVGGVLRGLSTYWERFATRWTDGISCVSAGEIAIADNRSLRATWFLCPNGVDLAAFRPPTAIEVDSARKRLGLGRQLVVLCVGRLCEQKGQDVLLDAWSRLDKDKDVLLVLVGDGPSRAALEALSGRDVVFVGDSADVVSWYQVAALAVQPSRWDGASLALREAMACGLSLVATDVAGVSEVLAADSGAVVPAGDAVALAHAIKARVSDEKLRTSEGIAARRAAMNFMDLSKTVYETDRMYAEVLRRYM